ncbi:hypothetical protein [Limosilactobacillus reuteri]|uniref:hypothetical protein n=1 Tax=Limosilactobacillus reuteri TaxID=1598 RepID=UPI001E45DE4D|nr:hypothetical protein [Limosilactobacillus reuteri]MCC4466438.1 hypothetical protein [Limosilactobacillus reuteri]MCC4474214.1 hypothetical protein [Limosilactobacillus reuteri]
MISENADVLLASFGLKGIKQSNLKQEKINTLINSINDYSNEQLLELFFAELKQAYLSDSQFNHFTFNEIDTLIAEEKAFMSSYI